MLYLVFIIRIALILVGAIALVRFVYKSSWKNIIAWLSAATCSMIISWQVSSFIDYFEDYSTVKNLTYISGIASAVFLLLIYLPLIRYSTIKKNTKFPTEIILLTTALVTFVASVCYVTGELTYILGVLIEVLVFICMTMLSEVRFDRNITKVNEQLLSAQLSHYEAIRQSNFELRRIKHDMKNHLLVVRDMAEKGNNDELIAYVDRLTDEVVSSDVFCRTGNDIADAILSDKNNKAAKRNIVLKVSGELAGVEIDSVDLCTIIANLLDNAIEAVSRLYNFNPSERHKVITIDFKKNANFLVIEQSNYSAYKMRSDKGRFITSKDSPDHGFGIYNIKQAIKRNDGEFEIKEQEGEFTKYTFEIILPIKAGK